MLIQPSQADVRRFFCGAYAKSRSGSKLEAIEILASQWIDEHPEYHAELADVDGILVPGGFGDRGFEGKVATSKYARDHKIPYFGICYGMQAAVVDILRDKGGLPGANTTEIDRQCADPAIALITEWRTASGEIERRSADSDMGGTMRLGSQVCHLHPGSKAHEIYGSEQIEERHRHRYEVNNNLLPQIKEAGLVIGGLSSDKTLVETVELPDHPWFFASQFHPEFTSTPRDGHPLFQGFVAAATAFQEQK